MESHIDLELLIHTKQCAELNLLIPLLYKCAVNLCNACGTQQYKVVLFCV